MRWTLIAALAVGTAAGACGAADGGLSSNDSSAGSGDSSLSRLEELDLPSTTYARRFSASGTTTGAASASSAGSSSGSTGSTPGAPTGVAQSSSAGAGDRTGGDSTGAASGAATNAASSSAGTGAGGSTGGASTGSGLGTGAAPSGALAGYESWAWLYADYQASLGAVADNVGSFTHISPTFYTINYAYASGVAYYSNCGGGSSCTDSGSNDFDGLTTQQVAAEINGLGLATIPLIYGGAANSGVDTGVQNILNDTNGAQGSFITAMVQEAVANGYAGYNLDWEVGSGVGSAYAASFVAFVDAFKTALAVHGMSLSADAVVSNINGCWCSGNDGYLDFGLLSSSSLDRLVIEDYTASYGAASTSCQPAVLGSTAPIDCPLNSSGSDVTFTGLLNYMCSNLPANMVVVGVESYSTATNGFAGEAISTMQAYGIDKVAVWPQQEGSYPFLSDNGLVAPQGDWYSLLAGFLDGQ
jgi:hypothetical protein